MKNSKAKDRPRSSQMPSFQIYQTYPAFHIETFPLITPRECIPWQRDSGTNAHLKGDITSKPQDLNNPAVIPGKLFRTYPQHWHESSFVFQANLAEKGCAIHVTDHHPL